MLLDYQKIIRRHCKSTSKMAKNHRQQKFLCFFSNFIFNNKYYLCYLISAFLGKKKDNKYSYWLYLNLSSTCCCFLLRCLYPQ